MAGFIVLVGYCMSLENVPPSHRAFLFSPNQRADFYYGCQYFHQGPHCRTDSQPLAGLAMGQGNTVSFLWPHQS